MFERTIVTSLIAGALVFSVSCSREPENYSDCILQNVKSGMSDYATAQVTAACKEKFADDRDTATNGALVELPDEARRDLTGRLRPSFGNTWSGNVYNGSDNWQVEELRIRIAQPGWSHFSQFLEENLRSEEYLVNVSIPPLSNATFTLSVNWQRDEEYKWQIVSARGRQVR